MKIISKFKDYYDTVSDSYGVDKSIIYKRFSITLGKNEIPSILHVDIHKIQENPFSHLASLFRYRNKSIHYYWRYFVIGFCGRLYVGFVFEDVGESPIIEWGENVFDRFKQTHKETRLLKQLINDIENLDFNDFFQYYQTPVFVFDINRFEQRVMLNPRLANYQFFRVFGTYEAFQEIQMYISGVLGQSEKEAKPLTDEEKIIAHGFDLKHSFRKDKKQ